MLIQQRLILCRVEGFAVAVQVKRFFEAVQLAARQSRHN